MIRQASCFGCFGELGLQSVSQPTFEVAHHAGWAVMRVSGEIDMATAPQLRHHVVTVTTDTPDGLVLDLNSVDFIDSTGLGVIVGAARRMRMNDADFRIVCAQAHLVDLFRITRLSEVLDLFETLEEAFVDIDPTVDWAGA